MKFHSFRQYILSHPTLPREHPSITSSCATYTSIALQNIDSTLNDSAVIITALECVPFSSPEDLLAMLLEELVNVAQTLSAKLPLALAIDKRSFGFVGNAIEILVGIHPNVSAAPLWTGTMKMPEGEHLRFFDEFNSSNNSRKWRALSPSASPLFMRV